VPKISGSIVVGPETSVRGEFVDDQGRPALATDVIFPIIRMERSEVWIPVGTAFFISNNGLFATAKHVLVDSDGHALPNLYGLHASLTENRIIVREVHKTVLHETADVAVAHLFDKQFAEEGKQTRNKLLPITAAIPESGSRVVSWAFPRPQMRRHDTGVALKIVGTAMEGVMEEWHPLGRDRVLLPGPCFRTNMVLAPGVSGGPVVFGDGSVFALNSTGYDGTELGYLSPVSAILSLTVENIRLPDGDVRKTIEVAELADKGLVVIR
jgi:trypsin-like peptidase